MTVLLEVASTPWLNIHHLTALPEIEHALAQRSVIYEEQNISQGKWNCVKVLG